MSRPKRKLRIIAKPDAAARRQNKGAQRQAIKKMNPRVRNRKPLYYPTIRTADVPPTKH